MGLSPAQIRMRKTGIGASEAPMVLGESPHGGRIALYMRKLGLADDFTTPAQEMGNLLENGIATYYARKTGAKLKGATTLRHPRDHWMLATPDRYVNGGQKLLQIKLVGIWMAHHWQDTDEGIPDYVRVQVTQEMDVSGIHLCDVAALIGGTDPRIYQVEYDRDLADGIREANRAFWFDHILPKIPPESDGSDDMNELLKRLYPRSRGPAIVASPELEALASLLIRARANASAWTTEQARIEQEMKRLMGPVEAVEGAGWKVTWRANTKARPFVFKSDEEQQAKRKAA